MTSYEQPGHAAAAEMDDVPSIDERIAAATQYEADDTYFQRTMAEARQGELATLYGTSGHFAGSISATSDRARLEAHFSTHKLGRVYSNLDAIAGFRGWEMSAAGFYRFDEQSSRRVADLVASGHPFAVTGTKSQLDGDIHQQPSATNELYRQIWTPLSDEHGRLPVYRRVTAPVQDIRVRERSYVEQDWLLLPQLEIPTAEEE